MSKLIERAKMKYGILRVRRLGKLSVIAPGAPVHGSMTWSTPRVFFCDKKATRATDQVGILLIARVEKMYYTVIDRQYPKRDHLLLDITVVLLFIFVSISK